MSERTRGGSRSARQAAIRAPMEYPHHVRPLDPEMLEQSPGVARHDRGVVVLGPMKLLAAAVAPVVMGEHAEARTGERLDP